MNKVIQPLFQGNKKVIHIFGAPGTFKTSFLTQIIWNKLQEGVKQIYLIDVSGQFPYVKLRPIEEQLQKLIVFQPKSIQEELLILDNFDLTGIDERTILLIDDVFHRLNPEEKETSHLESYLLAMINSISRRLSFPVFLTNEVRGFEERIHPLRETLIIKYLDEHYFFERPRNQAKVKVYSYIDKQLKYLTELKLDQSGLFPDLF